MVEWLGSLPMAQRLGVLLGLHAGPHRRTSAARTFEGPHARTNELELHHRRMLLQLFVLRPAACAALRAVLSRLIAAASRRLNRGGGASAAAAGLVRAACASALEMVDLLETQLWARYYRSAERWTC